jgi:hypothetical protein
MLQMRVDRVKSNDVDVLHKRVAAILFDALEIDAAQS